jgi:hypothetical protein
MAEGLGKGAGLTLLAIPMVEAFKPQFQRILSNFLGLGRAIEVPHTHYCGGVTRVLTSTTLYHL